MKKIDEEEKLKGCGDWGRNEERGRDMKRKIVEEGKKEKKRKEGD